MAFLLKNSPFSIARSFFFPFFLFHFGFFFRLTLRQYLHQSFLAKANTVRPWIQGSGFWALGFGILCILSRSSWFLWVSGSACSGLGNKNINNSNNSNNNNEDNKDIGDRRDSRRHPIPSGLTNEFRAFAPCDLKRFRTH